MRLAVCASILAGVTLSAQIAPQKIVVESPTMKADRTMPRDYTPDGRHFVGYALDSNLDLKPGLNRAELLEAIKGHVIGQGELVTVYERKAPGAEE